MLPHVMGFNRTENFRKFGKIAEAMGENVEGLSMYKNAEKSIEPVENLLNAVQIPFRLGQYGISRDDLPRLVEGELRQARLFIPNPRDVTPEDLKGYIRKGLLMLISGEKGPVFVLSARVPGMGKERLISHGRFGHGRIMKMVSPSPPERLGHNLSCPRKRASRISTI